MTTDDLAAHIEKGFDEDTSQDIDEDLGCYDRMPFVTNAACGDGDTRGGGEPQPTKTEALTPEQVTAVAAVADDDAIIEGVARAPRLHRHRGGTYVDEDDDDDDVREDDDGDDAAHVSTAASAAAEAARRAATHVLAYIPSSGSNGSGRHGGGGAGEASSHGVASSTVSECLELVTAARDVIKPGVWHHISASHIPPPGVAGGLTLLADGEPVAARPPHARVVGGHVATAAATTAVAAAEATPPPPPHGARCRGGRDARGDDDADYPRDDVINDGDGEYDPAASTDVAAADARSLHLGLRGRKRVRVRSRCRAAHPRDSLPHRVAGLAALPSRASGSAVVPLRRTGEGGFHAPIAAPTATLTATPAATPTAAPTAHPTAPSSAPPMPAPSFA